MAFSVAFTFKGIDQYSANMRKIVEATKSFNETIKKLNNILQTNRTKSQEATEAMKNMASAAENACKSMNTYTECILKATGATAGLSSFAKEAARDVERAAAATARAARTGYKPNFVMSPTGAAVSYAAAKAATGMVPYGMGQYTRPNWTPTSPYNRGYMVPYDRRGGMQAYQSGYTPNYQMFGNSTSRALARAVGSGMVLIPGPGTGLARMGSGGMSNVSGGPNSWTTASIGGNGSWPGSAVVHMAHMGGGTYAQAAARKRFNGLAPYLSTHDAYRGATNLGILGGIGLGVGGYALKQAMDFETEFAEVHKQIADRSSAGNIEQAKRNILSDYAKLPYDRSDITHAYATVAQHDVQNAGLLQGFARVGMNAGVDWGMQSEESTHLMMKIRNASKKNGKMMNPKQLALVSDSINQLNKFGGVHGKDVVSQLAELSGIAAAYNIPLNDMAALIGTTVKFGATPEQGKTTINRLFSVLAGSRLSKGQKRQAFLIGMTGAGKGTKWNTAQQEALIGKFEKDFAADPMAATTKFYSNLSKMDPLRAGNVLTALYGRTGNYQAHLRNLMLNLPELAKMRELANPNTPGTAGSAAREAAIRNDTTANAIKSVFHSIGRLFTEGGGLLLSNSHIKESIKNFAEGFSKLTETIINVMRKHPQLVGWMFNIGMGLSALAAGVGALAAVLHFIMPVVKLMQFGGAATLYNMTKGKALRGGALQTSASLASEGAGLYGALNLSRSKFFKTARRMGGGLPGLGAAVVGSWRPVANLMPGRGGLSALGGVLMNPLSKLAGLLAWFITPLGLLTAGLVALGGVLLIAYTRCKPFKEFVDTLATLIGTTLVNAITTVIDSIAWAIDALMASPFGDMIKTWTEQMKESMGKTKHAIQEKQDSFARSSLEGQKTFGSIPNMFNKDKMELSLKLTNDGWVMMPGNSFFGNVVVNNLNSGTGMNNVNGLTNLGGFHKSHMGGYG